MTRPPIDPAPLPEGTLRELDAVFAQPEHARWQDFYRDRARPCPFFERVPDENLAQWLREGLVAPGRAIDIGCGNGRNAIHLARCGFTVDAVDFSASAAAWAGEEAAAAGVPVTVHCASVFDLPLAAGAYDLVYDSGCFHHMPPHRRQAYVQRVATLLRPGGTLGLVCFAPEGGSGYSDDDVYRLRSLGGGLGYTEERLRRIWSPPLRIESVRRMVGQGTGQGFFGRDFLWALRACKA